MPDKDFEISLAMSWCFIAVLAFTRREREYVKESRKLVEKKQKPHMRVADDDEVDESVEQPVAEPVVQHPQPEVNDDYQPPHQTPTMNPVTICPLAPVKPKEQNNLGISLARG